MTRVTVDEGLLSKLHNLSEPSLGITVRVDQDQQVVFVLRVWLFRKHGQP